MGDSSGRDEHTIAISLARRRILDGIRRVAQGSSSSSRPIFYRILRASTSSHSVEFRKSLTAAISVINPCGESYHLIVPLIFQRDGWALRNAAKLRVKIFRILIFDD